MSDARYDAVIAGGGHHATIIAPYLARCGLSVLVIEPSAHLGGGACGSEGPAPGFTMNHCSHWTRFYSHPAYRDFELHDEGRRGTRYDTASTPLGRVGQPDDLLGALAFLVSDESAFVTGDTLLVNGGRRFG